MAADFKEELDWGKRYERPIAEALTHKLWPGSLVITNQDKATLDFTVVGSQVGSLQHLAFLEVKARRIHSEAYGQTMVVEDKWQAARYAKKFFKVPTLLVLLFEDRLGWLDLSEPPNKKEEVTRRDRNTSAMHCFWDIERMTFSEELAAEIYRRVDGSE